MGCDGGTIPKRHELVRMKKKPEQKDKDMERNAKWSQCSISQEELKRPIVSCELGFLYNKESVIEFLLDKTSSSSAGHIRSLKDVKELKLTVNSGYNESKGELADQYHDTQASKYICPVVGIEMNGKYKFCFLWVCGCVMSERALKEVPGTTCHKCGATFAENDIVLLNCEGDDFLKMRERMEARREAAKQARKAKKEKRKAVEDSSTGTVVDELNNGHHSKDSNEAKINGSGAKRVSSDAIVNLHNKKGKKDKLSNGHASGVNVTVSKQTTSSSSSSVDLASRKVYKNLFTSSEQARGRPDEKKSNWITYNPYHL